MGGPKFDRDGKPVMHLYSCHGCSAHLASAVAPPSTGSRLCSKCETARKTRQADWGDFMKGDRVKPAYRGHVFGPYETLVVMSAEGDSVEVFALGFPDSRAWLRADELTFSGTMFRR
jgi:hypothetical protein